MDYLKLLHCLKKEFLEAGRTRYLNMHIVPRIILTVVFAIPRGFFWLARLGYWFTWFFFKALSAPVDFLSAWFDKQKESLGDIAKACMVLVCMPFIFFQQILLAFNSFAFFFQWFGLMIYSYVLTLGSVRWQPVISCATFEEE